MVNLEITEIIALLIISIAFVFMVFAMLKDSKWKWLTLGLGFFVFEQIFTNLEHLWLNNIFNFLEHSFALLGCIAFCIACYISYKKMRYS